MPILIWRQLSTERIFRPSSHNNEKLSNASKSTVFNNAQLTSHRFPFENLCMFNLEEELWIDYPHPTTIKQLRLFIDMRAQYHYFKLVVFSALT